MSLKPRAVSVLVALRRAPRSPLQLSMAIADACLADTRTLLAAMDGSTRGDIAYITVTRQAVALTDVGRAWLELDGRPATPPVDPKRDAEAAAWLAEMELS